MSNKKQTTVECASKHPEVMAAIDHAIESNTDRRRSATAQTNVPETTKEQRVLGYRRSRASALFPAMPPDEFDALKTDMQAHGQREPILVSGDEVIDGWHRLRACADLGLTPDVKPMPGDAEAFTLSISLNLQRRQLSSGARALTAARLSLMAPADLQGAVEGDAQRGLTVPKVAAMFAVSERSIRSARRIFESNDAPLIEAALAGEIAVSAAAQIAAEEDEEQRRAALDVALDRDTGAADRQATTAALRRFGKLKTGQSVDNTEPFDPEAAARAVDELRERLVRAAATLLKAIEHSPALEPASAEALLRAVEAALRPLLKKLKPAVK